MDNDTMVAATQFLPIETMQLWDVGVVTDWTNAAVSQKAEADDGDHYFAIDPEDGLEWEPTHWAPMPNSSARHQSGRTGAGEELMHSSKPCKADLTALEQAFRAGWAARDIACPSINAVLLTPSAAWAAFLAGEMKAFEA